MHFIPIQNVLCYFRIFFEFFRINKNRLTLYIWTTWCATAQNLNFLHFIFSKKNDFIPPVKFITQNIDNIVLFLFCWHRSSLNGRIQWINWKNWTVQSTVMLWNGHNHWTTFLLGCTIFFYQILHFEHGRGFILLAFSSLVRTRPEMEMSQWINEL